MSGRTRAGWSWRSVIQKAFSVIRTGLFFLSHGLAIRRLLLSVTPENALEGTLAPADGSEHSQPRDEPRTGWSGAARPAPPKHQAAASPLECRFELPRSGPRGTPALGRDFRGWSGSGVIVAEAMGGDAGAAFRPGQVRQLICAASSRVTCRRNIGFTAECYSDC